MRFEHLDRSRMPVSVPCSGFMSDRHVGSTRRRAPCLLVFEDLDGLLLTVAKTRIVRRDGIRFQGLRYISPTLAGYVGRSVLIRYDPRDITEIRVFDHEEFICKAVNQDHHGQKVSLKEIQAARNARRRALREGINERIAVVATHTSPTPPAKAPPAPRRKLKVYKEDLR